MTKRLVGADTIYGKGSKSSVVNEQVENSPEGLRISQGSTLMVLTVRSGRAFSRDDQFFSRTREERTSYVEKAAVNVVRKLLISRMHFKKNLFLLD